MRKTFLFMFLLLIALTSASGCTPRLKSINITPSTMTGETYMEYRFEVNGKYSNGNSFLYDAAEWSVSPTSGQIYCSSGTRGAQAYFLAREPGDYVIKAYSEEGALWAEAKASLSFIPRLSWIGITPNKVQLNEGETCELSASGYDQEGGPIEINPNWSVLGGIGTIAPGSGKKVVFTANTVGSGNIKASYDDREAFAEILVSYIPVLSRIEIAPSEHTMAEGETKTFKATGYDQKGNVLSINPTWRVTGSIGTITGTGSSISFKATRGGLGTLVATQGTIEASASVEVTYYKYLSRIQIAPTSKTLKEGQVFLWGSIGYDQYSREMTINPTWSVTGGVGTIFPSTGESTTFTAVMHGNGTVRVAQGAVWAQASVTVTYDPVLTSIGITPASCSLPLGKAQEFISTGFDQYGKTMPLSPTWTIIGGIGTFSPSSGATTTFTATNIGNGQIRANYGSISSVSEIAVTSAPVLTRIDILPASKTMLAGQKQLFSAKGFDQYNEEIMVNPTWSVTGDIGTVSPNMGSTTTFSAAKVNNGNLIATDGSVSKSAPITVLPKPKPTEIVTSHSSWTMMEKQKTFSVLAVRDQYGNPITDYTIRWDVAPIGRFVSYTENTATYSINEEVTSDTQVKIYILVYNADGAAQAEIAVTVPASAARTMSSISPSSVAMKLGEVCELSAHAYDQYECEMQLTWNLVQGGGEFIVGSSNSTKFLAASSGTIKITASAGGIISAPATITVSPISGQLIKETYYLLRIPDLGKAGFGLVVDELPAKATIALVHAWYGLTMQDDDFFGLKARMYVLDDDDREISKDLQLAFRYVSPDHEFYLFEDDIYDAFDGYSANNVYWFSVEDTRTTRTGWIHYLKIKLYWRQDNL